ncbi:MAG: leucine-rich repeat protein [Eubacterium sp.]|nr:leucine-rich repeat protein [Eubacterium sp.]
MDKWTAYKGIKIRFCLMLLVMMFFLGNGYAVQAEGLRKDRVCKKLPSVLSSRAQEGTEGSALEFTSENDVVSYVREQLKAKNKTITFDYVLSDAKVFICSDVSEIQNLINDFVESESSKIWTNIERGLYINTGNPNEGDYLRNSIYKTTLKNSAEAIPTSENGYEVTKISFELRMTYFTDATQEKVFENKAAEVIKGLNLANDTEYEKVVKIYDYITNHVSYDYTNLHNDKYILKQSAYAALINKTSVCQGYATLFYYMATYSGLDSRIVMGKSNIEQGSDNDLHAWNAVRIGNLYYYVDATWDSANPVEDTYFLNGKKDFYHHTDIYLDTPDGETLPSVALPKLADYSYYKNIAKIALVKNNTKVTVGDVIIENGKPSAEIEVVYRGKKLLLGIDYKVEYGIYQGTNKGYVRVVGIGLYQETIEIECNIKESKNDTLEVVKVGTKFKVGKNTYKVTKAGSIKTVTLVAAGKNLKSVSVPASVRKDGDIYLVTAIGPNVFKNQKKLTSVVIGKNVKSIGANCFSGCKKLKKITFKGSSLKKVGSNSFKKTSFSMVVVTPKSVKTKYAKLLKRGGISKKAKYK